MKKYLCLIAFKLMATLPGLAVVCPHCGQEGHDEWDCPQNPYAMCPHCHVPMSMGNHMPGCPNDPHAMCPHCGMIEGNHMPDCLNDPDRDCPYCHVPMSRGHGPNCPNDPDRSHHCPHCPMIFTGQGMVHTPDCPNR
ncbi:MAG: hypothetical protein LBJ78_00765 [Puniceicoccales bacterium]|jgi:hypothetical protein|nr:hypothetical protein [Puniceicoccales bacterium]